MKDSLRETLRKEEDQGLKRGHEIAKFYHLDDSKVLQEVTPLLLASPFVKRAQKESIKHSNRKIFVFEYPSDGLKVKGYISFINTPKKEKLIINIRGGNRFFGLPNPGGDIACMKHYTIVSTTFRGGISEGFDEFGGQDVNDVPHLIHFLPNLSELLSIQLPQSFHMIGSSRGGMQMFLALARFPELQSQVEKIVSLSGLLDIKAMAKERADMREMFLNEFGMKVENEKEWLDARDPLQAAQKLRKDLPILILQGCKDIRCSLQQGSSMIEVLKRQGNSVSHIEIEQGDHCLLNKKNRAELIADWFERACDLHGAAHRAAL